MAAPRVNLSLAPILTDQKAGLAPSTVSQFFGVTRMGYEHRLPASVARTLSH